jgi:hypothetical protein
MYEGIMLYNLGICPAFTTEMIDSYNIITLYIAVTDSIIFDHILGRNGREPNFTIDPLYFHWGKIFGIIMYNGISLTFHIIPTDTLNKCRPHSNQNLVEFVWNYCNIMK